MLVWAGAFGIGDETGPSQGIISKRWLFWRICWSVSGNSNDHLPVQVLQLGFQILHKNPQKG